MSEAIVEDSQEEILKKANKAAAERKRRADIAVAKKALVKADLDSDTKLTPEQRSRAVEALEKHPGLKGKALEAWILEGKDLKAQVAEGQAAKKAAVKDDRQRKNLTRSADPEASQLAQDAKALAPEIKSAFLPKDAREFIEKFKVKGTGLEIKVSRTDLGGVPGDPAPVGTFELGALEAWAVKGVKDKEVRAGLTAIAKDSRLWGRKLGLMILATIAAQDAKKK